MRSFPVKPDSKPVEEGVHKGRILRVEYRDEPYAYIDLIVLVEGHEGIELKYGCPQNITPSSKFGKILEAFGKNLTVNSEITEKDIEETFMNKYVRFQTINELVTRKDGSKAEFARIVDGSLKPIEGNLQ